MSSLISLRSYQRRRKSAGARLEGAYAQALSNQGSMPPLILSPGQPPGTAPEGTKPLAIPREKRVKSARETRKEQEASDIFPELQRSEVDPEWGKTKYSEDFCPKKADPIPVRPISPTRMNNPHPSKEFMIWKQPTRIHEHKKAVHPPPDVWRYIYERFYEDYLDKYNTGDAKNEVPITNLAKIKFPGKKETPTRPINGISGKKAHLNSRQHSSHASTSGEESTAHIRPPSPKSLVMHQTLKGESLPVFKEWLRTATSNERDLLLEMLHAAHEDSEEARLAKVVSDVLQAQSAERVQEWLKNANPTDRQIVLHVLETLAVTTAEGNFVGGQGTYPALYPRLQHRHHRSHTFPLSLQGGHHSYSGLGDARSRHHHHHHHHRHHHRSKHSPSSSSSKHSSTGSEGVGQRSGAQMGLVGKKIAKPERVYDENPEIWHNRILRKKLGTSKMHAAGVFNQPKRETGQHFAIHPEWPTA